MKVLLHICCANCAIAPVKTLREQNHTVTGFFYNPNIHPYMEYLKRLEAVRGYAKATQLDVFFQGDYGLEDFLAQVAQDPANRCSYCYETRMRSTAEFAAANGYDAFSSSLLASPFQDHAAVRAFGEELSKLFNIDFVYQDFRTGWQDATQTSLAMGLYRQTYCGCIYSEKDCYYPIRTN